MVLRTANNIWKENVMDKKKVNKKILKAASIMFAVAALLFIGSAVNHIINTGEQIISTICFALASGLLAFDCYRKSK